MKIDLSRLVPCGVDYKKQLKTFGCMYGFSFLYSFCSCIGKIDYEFRRIEWNSYGEDWKVEPLYALLKNNMVFFTLTAIVMLAFAVMYYISHFQGSKSIYLMRRLPRRNELAKRCLVLPIASVLIVAVTCAALIGIYYAYYLFKIPAHCRYPDQWQSLIQNLWSVML